MSRNSAPNMPLGVQLSRPIFPPGRQMGTSSSAAAWWWGANITPIDDMMTSNDASSNGRCSASACTHSTGRGLAWGVIPIFERGAQVVGCSR